MLITPPTCAVIGAVLPFTPLAHVLGFTTLPLRFFLILLGMIGTYLVLVELAKSRFYATGPHSERRSSTHEERTSRSVRRRAARFIHHSPSTPRLGSRPFPRRSPAGRGVSTAESSSTAIATTVGDPAVRR